MSGSKKGRGRPTTKGPHGTLKLSPEDLALLTADEIKALEAEAAGEAVDEHKEDLKARVKASFKAAKRRELAGETDDNEPTRTIMLDLAPHSNQIMLDGKVFFHGHTYEVSENVYKTLNEIQSRGWDHEDEVGNANQEACRRPRHITIGPNDATVAATALMRV